jgi:predicted KAP-like P-loop ATPase
MQPPLSIGLFGEWGSGKSFFMQKMKERVRQIASAARKSQSGQKEFGYYKNIVQVEFNAWHYVEGNLWASLVEHIFSNLRLEGIGEEDLDSEQNIADRLEKLLGTLREKTAEAEQKEAAGREIE